MDPPREPPSESLGQRIGTLRVQAGWTQADLAARLAVSRVAVSHFEMGLALPSERTVVLLAGLFKLEPLELVAGTSYPAAKRERLPAIACRYTEVEHQLALLHRDLDWLSRLSTKHAAKLSGAALRAAEEQIAALARSANDPHERELLAQARKTLRDARAGLGM
jgi:transcriptional regulator with XRE-family HTH domain